MSAERDMRMRVDRRWTSWVIIIHFTYPFSSEDKGQQSLSTSLTTSIESHLLIPMSAIISADLQTLQTEIVVNL